MNTALIVELGVLNALLAVNAFVVWKAAKGLIERLYDRQKVMDHYVKEVGREDLRAANAADQATERADRVLADARQALEQVERHVSGR